jgi:hypothetical protein
MRRAMVAVIALCAAMILSCSSTTQMPLATTIPASTDTPLPTATPTGPPEPTPTSGAESDTMGTPVPSWEGLPVMPGAIEGRPAGLCYVYSIGVSTEEVETYYWEQMTARGWQLFKRQSSETGLFGGSAVVLDFARNRERANVIMAFSISDDYTVVMLTYLEPSEYVLAAYSRSIGCSS